MMNMAKTFDFAKSMKDMMGSFPSAFPMDTKAFEDAFKAQAAYGEKLAKVALDAATKSADLSAKWTKETLTKLGDVTKLKTDATDYSKALSDFAAAQSAMVSDNMTAFADIAKKVQSETVEIMMAAGKEAAEEAQSVVAKATNEATAAAKKAAATVN
jgi:hypothetical protein